MLKRPASTAATMLKRPAAAQAVVRKRPAANVDDRVNATRKELCHLLPDWEGESDSKAQVQIYLVIGAKLVNDRETSAAAANVDDDLPPLVDPASISKADFRKAFQDRGRPPPRQLEIDVYAGVREGP